MKKKILILTLAFGSFATLQAQRYFTKDGKIAFTSHAPMEKIEAVANTASSVLDAASGKIEFAVLIKSFQFEKALMQEHFNENYMESSKYPKSVFKGQIMEPGKIKFDKDGTYTAKINGDLTIHGVTKPVSTDAKFVVKNGEISAQSSLRVLVADYDIDIPAVVRDNIAKEVNIEIKVDYQLLKS